MSLREINIEKVVAKAVRPLLNGHSNVAVSVAVTFKGMSSQYHFGELTHYKTKLPIPLNGKTRYEIGSISKTFTATLYAYAISKNVQVGSMTIGEVLSPVGVTWPADLSALQLNWLASYFSGLPEDNVSNTDRPPSQNYPYELSTMYTWITEQPIVISTPRVYAYSNLGWALLALSLPATVSPESSYEQLINSIILSPAGVDMPDTRFYTPSENHILPQGYGKKFEDAPPTQNTWPAYNGAGGLVSNLDDMLTWLEFNMGLLRECNLNGLLSDLQQPHATTSEGESIGLGWFLPKLELSGEKVDLVVKDGGVSGGTSWIGFTLDRSIGVVILCNFHPSPSVTQTGHKIIKELLTS